MTTARTCPDCAVNPGEPHDDGCDVARCLTDGGQRLSCGEDGVTEYIRRRANDGVPVARTHHCGADVWTGRWPGEIECEEYGWWVQDRCAEGLGFVPCASDAPGAMQDLNRLVMDCEWDRAAERWRRRETVR